MSNPLDNLPPAAPYREAAFLSLLDQSLGRQLREALDGEGAVCTVTVTRVHDEYQFTIHTPEGGT